MLGCCIINIGWLTSLVDSPINLVMSLHLFLMVRYIFNLSILYIFFRLCVDMDDILVLCMTTHLLLDCMLLVYVGHTFIPLSPTP